MTTAPTLEDSLGQWLKQDSAGAEISGIIRAIAQAGIQLAALLAGYELEQNPAGGGTENADGDIQKPLDILSNQLFERELEKLPLSFLASEERDELTRIDPSARYGVAIDPLDGSSNIETNMSIGSIFSILEVSAENLYQGSLGQWQRAAGFLFYGPRTLLVLTCGQGTGLFLLDRQREEFVLLGQGMSIPPGQREFAINTSNYRFWDDSIRHFIDDCVAGSEGYLGKDFNMRWNAALVAEAFRILVRGGVFLYPGDSRPKYANGRLRLLYEALPLAMIIEQAGGEASDGNQRILDMSLASLHERVPLIFGSGDRVREVIEYISGQAIETTRFPLFKSRGLFRT